MSCHWVAFQNPQEFNMPYVSAERQVFCNKGISIKQSGNCMLVKITHKHSAVRFAKATR